MPAGSTSPHKSQEDLDAAKKEEERLKNQQSATDLFSQWKNSPEYSEWKPPMQTAQSRRVLGLKGSGRYANEHSNMVFDLHKDPETKEIKWRVNLQASAGPFHKYTGEPNSEGNYKRTPTVSFPGEPKVKGFDPYGGIKKDLYSRDLMLRGKTASPYAYRRGQNPPPANESTDRYSEISNTVMKHLNETVSSVKISSFTIPISETWNPSVDKRFEQGMINAYQARQDAFGDPIPAVSNLLTSGLGPKSTVKPTPIVFIPQKSQQKKKPIPKIVAIGQQMMLPFQQSLVSLPPIRS